MKSGKLQTACALFIFAVVLFFSSAIQGTFLLAGQDRISESDADWLSKAPAIKQVMPILGKLHRVNEERLVALRHRIHKDFYDYYSSRFGPYESMQPGTIPADALTAFGGLGRFYYVPELTVLDTHGLIDKTVAHNPVTTDNKDRGIAHDRRPPKAYLKERGPNFFMFYPQDSLEAALEIGSYAAEVTPGVWMPFEAVSRAWASEHFGRFNLHAPTPPLKTFSVIYDRGLSLEGFALFQEMGSEKSSLVLNRKAPQWMVFRWRVAPGVSEEFVMSARLVDELGERRFQVEEVIRHPMLDDSTIWWPVNQSADHLFDIELPADLPAGQYELRLVVYDHASRTVTAELETWRSDVLLAIVTLD